MHLTMFGIPVALEAFKASKEVLVRRPAPPGIRPFLENKRSIQGGEGEHGVRGTNATLKPKHTRLAAEISTLHASMCTVARTEA